MSPQYVHPTARRLVVAAVLCTGLALAAGTTGAQAEPVTSLFELGDSVNPDVPGTGELQGSLTIPGPDWADLFNADGSPRDTDGNGVPDYAQVFGGRAALFVADDISAAGAIDFSIRHGANHLETGLVSNVNDDLGNVYIFETTDSAGNLVLFAGLERLQGGASTVEIELDQNLFQLGYGWPGRTGWEIWGQNRAKDVRVTLTFSASGTLSTFAVDALETASNGKLSWTRKATLAGEGCNQADTGTTPALEAKTFCAFGNAAAIPGAAWTSYDATGQPATTLGPDRFFEVGVNLGKLLGTTDPNYRYTSLQVRTPSDLAFGQLGGN